MIGPEYKWCKEYELGRSDHFPIIIEDEREVSTKHHHRWSIGRAYWMQFQKERKITTKMRDQNTIKKHAAWWKEKCERKERIVRVEYRKHN